MRCTVATSTRARSARFQTIVSQGIVSARRLLPSSFSLRKDLALRISALAFFVLLTSPGLGAGKLFRVARIYSSGDYSTASIAVADLNGDGKLDLVLASNCNTNRFCDGFVGVLLGNG